MAGPAATFREIHRLRRYAKDLQTEIDRGPIRLKAQQGKVTRAEEALREAQEALKRLKVTVKDKEVSLKTAYSQIAKHEKQLNEAASKKEYDALKGEIAAEKANCQRLEDEILEGMAGTEDRTAQLPELEKAIAEAKQEYARYEADYQSRLDGLTSQFDETQQKLREIEATLPDDVRVTYERLVAARGPDALAPVEGRTCGACYTEITAQSYNDLLVGRLVACKACGRMLYLPE